MRIDTETDPVAAKSFAAKLVSIFDLSIRAKATRNGSLFIAVDEPVHLLPTARGLRLEGGVYGSREYNDADSAK